MLLNALGYHFLRIARFKLSYALRKRITPKDARAKQAADEVLKEGIVVIPGFFPDEVFRKIKEEADGLRLGVINERAPRILRSVVVADDRPASSRLLEEHFAKNSFMNDVASAVLRKRIIVTPSVRVEKSWFSQEDLGKESTDKADNLHFDVSYPTTKCFLYLNDVDETNAAFSYARGSHKLTLARLWMEYGMSVRFWLWDKATRAVVTPEVDRDFLMRNGLELKSIVGKANTLIIVNTMGFHRRGDYLKTEPRELIQVSYRPLDSSRYLMREFFGKKK